MGTSGKQTLAERAHDALGEAHDDAIKALYAGCFTQLQGGTDIADVREHFRRGAQHIAALDEVAETVVDQVFSVIA